MKDCYKLGPRIILILYFILLMTATASYCQMVNPKIDKADEPFSYFSFPVDVIGFMDCREGTEITPEGYLFTGYGELMFFYGSPPQAVNQRVKTLYKGYLPIISYCFTQEGVRYSVTLFAYTLDGNPESPLLNFIRVQLENTSSSPRTAYWWVGTRYTAPSTSASGLPDHRFKRPATASKSGYYEQEGEEFSSEWEYSFQQNMMLRDGHVFYLFPTDKSPTKWITLKTPYSEQWKKPNILPTSPVGLVKYEIKLRVEEKKSLDFIMPYRPLSLSEEALADVRQAKFDDYFQKTVNFWENILAKGMKIYLPEPKVTNTFKANLIYDLIARDKIGQDYVQKVNEFQYDAFWLRDSAYIVRAYDVTGYHKIAEQCLNFFLKWQREDGNFLSQQGQYDGWGQALWAIGQHFVITHDLNFARKFFPPIKKAVDWLKEARVGDPLHLMPVTTPGDNEDITGHVTGHNFWALIGLKKAIAMAEGLGKEELAQQYHQEYDDYLNYLKKAIKKIAQKSGGYIPPGLDELGGQDWGNMLTVYPEQILKPFDPLVTKTLEETHKKYKEGIMTYGDGRWLHLYLTMKNTETEVIRGDEEQVLKEFYSILVHTSSTQAGFEFSILPWGDRDFGYNLTPHGWFAAKFRTLLRNMLVREERNELHLLSVISPFWVREGERISVSDAPTNFGMVNFSFEAEKGEARLRLQSDFRQAPEKIVVHLPWFVNLLQASADGQPLKAKNKNLYLSAQTKELKLKWEIRPVGAWSYEFFVQDYKEKYQAKYKEFLEKGERM